jgi:hypothetical protein
MFHELMRAMRAKERKIGLARIKSGQINRTIEQVSDCNGLAMA